MPKTDAVAARTIGIETGKNMLHLIGLDEKGAIVLREKLSRGRIVARLANVPQCLIGIEAGMATHYIARDLIALGHAIDLCVRCGLPGTRNRRRPRAARLQHRSHAASPRRDRDQSHPGCTRHSDPRSSRMARSQGPQGSRQHLAPAAAATLTRAQSTRKHLAVYAGQLAVEPCLQILRRHRRPLLLRLEPAHRPALENNVHRPPRLGIRRSHCEDWYKELASGSCDSCSVGCSEPSLIEAATTCSLNRRIPAPSIANLSSMSALSITRRSADSGRAVDCRFQSMMLEITE
jgi:hypothetical protein